MTTSKANKFRLDLAVGQAWEDAGEMYFNTVNCDIVKAPNKTFKDWDFKVVKPNGGAFTVEVKADMRAGDTNNLAVEFECNRQKSGITATKSTYWLHLSPTDKTVYKFLTKDLKALIKANPNMRQVKCGDGFRAVCYLIPKSTVERFKVKWSEDFWVETN